MNFFVQKSELRDLYDKVAAGERISEADALRLFESRDLNALGAIADFVRLRKAGNRASYIINRYINYSNYCILSCQFCSFARKKRDADGFQLSVEEIVGKAREALALGITELHIVGGLHPSLPFNYYTGMLQALRQLDPRLQLKCFTAIEILHLAWLAKKTVPDTLAALKAAGVTSIPSPEAARKFFARRSARPSPGARSRPKNIWMSIASGTKWADAAPARCFLAMSNPSRTGSTICGNCGSCRMKPAVLPASSHCPTNRRTTRYPCQNVSRLVLTHLHTLAISAGSYLDNFDRITAHWSGHGTEAGAGGPELWRG